MSEPRQGPDTVAPYRDRVTAALHDVYGAESRITCRSTRALGYSISFLFDVEHGGTREALFAKVRRASKFGGYEAVDSQSKTAQLGRLEFDILTRAHAWFSRHTPDLGVVRPVTYVDDCHALVVAAAEGVAADRLAGPPAHPLFAAAAVRAGRWLRAFHDHVGPAGVQPWDADAFAARLRRVCAALTEAGLDAPMVDSLQRRTLNQAARTAGRPCAHALVHGDYKLRHIWTTAQRMEVLDFGNAHVAPVAEDLAAFIVELEVGEFGALRPAQPGAHATAGAFLEAYGPIPTPRVLSLQLVLARMKKWARRREKLSSSSTGRNVQRLLRLTGTEDMARRQILDPWFLGRVEPELTWLEQETGDEQVGPAFTGTLAAALQPPGADARATR
ncbi:MAG TPA: phosphotransferase [Luteitalea sp.]|nr:phosphotransferase [Luteitalea sp.]